MSRQLRVLHVYKNYYPTFGGIESQIRTLCEGLRARDVDARVLVVSTTRRSVYDTVNGVPVYRMARFAAPASTPLSISFFRAFAGAECDLIHLHMPYPPGDLAYRLAPKGRPLVISYHSDVIRQRRLLRLYRPLLEWTLDHAAVICPTSPEYIQSSPFLCPRAERCRVIPSCPDPVRLGRVPDLTRVADLRAQYPGPIVLFVGMLRYYKGLNVLVDAMRGVDATLLIAGDGPERAALRRQIAQAQLADRVHLLGAVPDDDLPALYAIADVFVLPSVERAEALGLSMIEAMAAGTPAVCTRLGTGTTYVNVDGETGLVVRPRDPAALGAALVRLITDEELRRRLGENARRRAQREFSPARVLDLVRGIYDDVAGSNRLESEQTRQ